MKSWLVFAIAFALGATIGFAQTPIYTMRVIHDQNVYAAPSAESAVIGRLTARQRVFVVEPGDDFSRIDRRGITGPAYVPNDALAADAPDPRDPGCHCPDQLRPDGRVCGGSSSFCRPGGRGVDCRRPDGEPQTCPAPH